MRFDELIGLLQSQYRDNAREVEPGHWVVEVMTSSDRSQVVHFLLEEVAAEGRDVSRIVVDSPIGPVPQRQDFEQLLRKNAELDVGAICVEDFRNEEGELTTYLTLRVSHLLATMDFEESWEMIEKVARVADDLERDLYARDLH